MPRCDGDDESRKEPIPDHHNHDDVVVPRQMPRNTVLHGKDKRGRYHQKDAEALYDLLENEVIPLYYQVSSQGIPTGWTRIMKEAIKSNAPRFSARRMVKEYVEKYYSKALQGLAGME